MVNLSKFILSFTLLLLVSAGHYAYAQEGNIEVVKEFEFDLLLNQKRIKADSTDKKGYRIQIYFGTDMKEAQKVKDEFIQKYPELADQVYMTYTQPYWRVRIGNYYRPIDAQPDIRKYGNVYDKIFLIKDDIELPVINIGPR